MNCPNCHTEITISRSQAAAALSKGHMGGCGASKKLTPCPFCRALMGVRELRKHLPICRRTITNK